MKRISSQQALESLKNGEVVIFPTDTVFGMACDFENMSAVQKIFELKGRDFNKPLAILIGSIEMFEDLIDSNFYDLEKSQLLNALIKEFWPGGLTLILNKSLKVDNLITAEGAKVGVRMPNHQQLLKLINDFGKPLVATSVNLSGESCLNSYDQIKDLFSDVSFVNFEEIQQGQPDNLVACVESTVLDLTENEVDGGFKILREGLIKKADLEKFYSF